MTDMAALGMAALSSRPWLRSRLAGLRTPGAEGLVTGWRLPASVQDSNGRR